MSTAAGIAVTIEFTTRQFATGARSNADSLPTGVLVVNGIDLPTTITIANTGVGIYTAAFTLPSALVADDQLGLRISAVVGGVSDNDIVWRDTIDNPVSGIPALVWSYVTRTLTSFGPINPGDFDSSAPFADPHVGDVGTELVVVIVDQDLAIVDVSAATELTIFLKRPGSHGVVLTKTAVLDTDGTDGKIRYNTVAGDFSVSGLYKIQGKVTLPTGGPFWSADSEFLVKGNLG